MEVIFRKEFDLRTWSQGTDVNEDTRRASRPEKSQKNLNCHKKRKKKTPQVDEKEIKAFDKGSKNNPFGLQICFVFSLQKRQNGTQYSLMRIKSREGTQQYRHFN